MIASDTVDCVLQECFFKPVSSEVCLAVDVTQLGKATSLPPFQHTKDVAVSLLSLSSFPPRKFLPWGFWSLRWHIHGLPWNIEAESTFPLNLSCSLQAQISRYMRGATSHPARAHIWSPLGCQRERNPCLSNITVVLTQTFSNSPFFSLLLAVFTGCLIYSKTMVNYVSDSQAYTCGCIEASEGSLMMMMAKPNCYCTQLYTETAHSL